MEAPSSSLSVEAMAVATASADDVVEPVASALPFADDTIGTGRKARFASSRTLTLTPPSSLPLFSDDLEFEVSFSASRNSLSHGCFSGPEPAAPTYKDAKYTRCLALRIISHRLEWNSVGVGGSSILPDDDKLPKCSEVRGKLFKVAPPPGDTDDDDGEFAVAVVAVDSSGDLKFRAASSNLHLRRRSRSVIPLAVVLDMIANDSSV